MGPTVETAETKESEFVFLRLPRDMVQDAMGLLDVLIAERPDLRVAAPRKTGALAVRMFLSRGIEALKQDMKK